MAEKNLIGFDPVRGKFVALSKEDWLKTRELEKSARLQGKQDLPPTDSDVPDGTEARIRRWINEHATKLRNDVSGYLNDIERDLAGMKDESELKLITQQIDQKSEQAHLDLSRAQQQCDNQISSVHLDLEESRRAFQAFRDEARLSRPADYSKRRASFIWLIFVGIFEIVLNATLLMDVNAFGLIGSIAQMGLISLINIVAFGGLAGLCFRNTSHAKRIRRFTGWLGIVLVLPLMATFNLLVGHFRDSMQAVVADLDADLAEIGADTFERLMDGALDFASFQSLLLVIMGSICFGLSAWKWWQSDDRYPRYGHEHRELKKKEDAYSRRFEEVQDMLTASIADARSWLDDTVHSLQIKKGHWQEKCSEAGMLVNEFENNLKQYQLDLNYLLNTYRTANIASRKSEPPRRFSSENSGDKLDEALFDPVRFNPPPNSPVDSVWDKTHQAITALQQAHRSAQERIPSLGSIGLAQQADAT